MEKIEVSFDALSELLQAITGPPHILREIMATAHLPSELLGEKKNPFAILIEEYNSQVRRHNRNKTLTPRELSQLIDIYKLRMRMTQLLKKGYTQITFGSSYWDENRRIPACFIFRGQDDNNVLTIHFPKIREHVDSIGSVGSTGDAEEVKRTGKELFDFVSRNRIQHIGALQPVEDVLLAN